MGGKLAGELDALEDSMLQAGRSRAEVRQARRAHLQAAIDDDSMPETPGESNWGRAQSMFPVPDERQLLEFFTQRPDAMHAILGDMYVAYEYEQRKDAGGAKENGRRMAPRDANLGKLWDITTPRYSMEPFEVAIRELIGERSLRAFAARVPMDHRELSRMMTGKSTPSMYYLEKIAIAGKVTPAFFLEYRISFVTTTVARIFARQPNLSIGVFKRLRQAAR